MVGKYDIKTEGTYDSVSWTSINTIIQKDFFKFVF